MESLTTCPHCHSSILPNLSFCPFCGKSIGQKEQSEEYSKDLYRILQVDPSAESEVIEAAYKRLAIKYHPDVNKSPDAQSRMQEINGAYQVLSNAQKRLHYDSIRQPQSVEHRDFAKHETSSEKKHATAKKDKQKEEPIAKQKYTPKEKQQKQKVDEPEKVGQTVSQQAKPTSATTQKPSGEVHSDKEKSSSIAKKAAKGSAVLTVLFIIATILTRGFGVEAIGTILFSTIPTFLFWWGVIAGIGWLSKRFGNWIIPATIILVIVICIGIVVAYVFLFPETIVPTPTITPLPTFTPLPPPTIPVVTTPSFACLKWDEVSTSDIGKEICVQGTVVRISQHSYPISQFRLYFSNLPNTFFMLDENYIYPDLKDGDCVQAWGIVESDTYGALFINLKNRALYLCSN